MGYRSLAASYWPVVGSEGQSSGTTHRVVCSTMAACAEVAARDGMSGTLLECTEAREVVQNNTWLGEVGDAVADTAEVGVAVVSNSLRDDTMEALADI